MSGRPRVDIRVWPDLATYASFECPGCGVNHGPVVDRKAGSVGPLWKWNGSVERPTFEPSILVRYTRRLTDDEIDRLSRGEDVPDAARELVCHSFVRDGRIEFLSDCSHALAGQTVDLPEIEP